MMQQLTKKQRAFVSVEDLTNAEIFALLKRARAFKQGALPHISGKKYMANLFFENSTRTHQSFEMAEHKLGIEVLDFDPRTSSVNKGETLYDTVLTLSALGVDAVVIRHSKEDYYKELVASDTIHSIIINGGDGAGQHPSQCLLDLMTIYEEFGHFDGLKIAIAGDLVHSRVARSNMEMLTRLGAELYFAGPAEWMDPTFAAYGTYLPIDDIIEQVDVMMLLRVQNERHDQPETYTKAAYLEQFGLTEAREARMQPHAIIMHPAPVNRNVEIADALVECSRSRIVRQMQNGVFARMAILERALGDE